jgi:hypothetical protein
MIPDDVFEARLAALAAHGPRGSPADPVDEPVDFFAFAAV